MIQRTVIHRAGDWTRPAARAEAQSSDNALPLTFLALAFGLAAGMALTGVVIPVVVHAVARAVAGI